MTITITMMMIMNDNDTDDDYNDDNDKEIINNGQHIVGRFIAPAFSLRSRCSR